MLSLLQFGAEDEAAGSAAEGSMGDAVKGAVKGAGEQQGGGGGGQKFDPASTASTASAMLAAGHQGGIATPTPAPPRPVSTDGETALKRVANPPENGAVSYGPR